MELPSITSTTQIPLFQCRRWLGISKPSISHTLFLTPIKCPKLRLATFSGSSFPVECNGLPSSTKIFIKGLPLTTSEGRLMKEFSEFGEVSQVKLLIDKESGQSLGFAYIWFVKEESAQMAVQEMNGKFFDGRFIYVTTAKPGSSKSWGRKASYKF